MSASIILAKELTTGIIIHIDEVNKSDNKSFCCYDCDKEMVVVKSKARKKDWHFRHKEDSECTGKKDKALHDYAVQILFRNYEVQLTKSLRINYSNARKEVWINDNYRSDVTVNYENQDIHFEVFVTHDLGNEK